MTDYTDKSKSTVVCKQIRWKQIPDVPENESKHFVEGIFSYCGAGSPETKKGISILGYSFNSDMKDTFFYSSDGDFLIVPQVGDLKIRTEMGLLVVCIGEFGVIPRGIKFQMVVEGPKTQHSGWICEVFGNHLHLPELGPIGANGLANPQDFEIPTAAYKDVQDGSFRIIAKVLGEFFVSDTNNHPCDVVAWRGNYYPFKYNLRKFNVMNSVSFDHPDPSIFTVMSAMSSTAGVAVLDFAVFKQRFMVAENTFRPPYFHRNTMSEFMGNIYGEYDAKPSGGFEPGCSSLHLAMTPHGPETTATEKAMNEELKPVKYKDTMAFMFETCFVLRIAHSANENNAVVEIDQDYHKCWNGMKKHFIKD